MKNVKIIILFFFFFLSNNLSAQQDGFSIKIKLLNRGLNETICLSINKDFSGYVFQSTLIDSALVDTNIIHFQGKLDFPTSAYIWIKGKKGGFSFLLSNASYDITMNVEEMWTAKIEPPSPEKEIYKIFMNERNLIAEKMNMAYDSAMLAEDNKDEELMEYYTDLNKYYMVEVDRFGVEFIKANPSSYYSLLLFQLFLQLDKEELRATFNLLDERNKSHPLGQRIYLDLFKKDFLRSTGNQLLPFQFIDEKDKEISIEDYKGNYVLLDFWATWCGPCIDQFENLIDFYLSNQERNFQIVAVSIDQDTKKWKDFLSYSEYPWINLLDQKDERGWFFFDYYGSKTIPFNILLGKNGEILQLNATTEDIQRILDEN